MSLEPIDTRSHPTEDPAMPCRTLEELAERIEIGAIPLEIVIKGIIENTNILDWDSNTEEKGNIVFTYDIEDSPVSLVIASNKARIIFNTGASSRSIMRSAHFTTALDSLISKQKLVLNDIDTSILDEIKNVLKSHNGFTAGFVEQSYSLVSDRYTIRDTYALDYNRPGDLGGRLTIHREAGICTLFLERNIRSEEAQDRQVRVDMRGSANDKICGSRIVARGELAEWIFTQLERLEMQQTGFSPKPAS